MELDELKKSWNALDAQLQKEPIADEQQIKELIANYKTNTRHSLGRRGFLQRFSLGIGAVGLAIILLICYIIWDVILIYFIYKRLIYKHLDNIKKNIEELKDICTE